jgi:hypothetical protein
LGQFADYLHTHFFKGKYGCKGKIFQKSYTGTNCLHIRSNQTTCFLGRLFRLICHGAGHAEMESFNPWGRNNPGRADLPVGLDAWQRIATGIG